LTLQVDRGVAGGRVDRGSFTARLALRRVRAPPAQRSPSPRTVPGAWRCVPWKNSSDVLAGRWSALSTSVSLAMDGMPVPRSRPPRPKECRQPVTVPAGDQLEQGQGEGWEKSPTQNAVMDGCSGHASE
jgi:hypothetical protein